MTRTMISLYDAKANKPVLITAVPDIGLLENLGVRVGTRVMIQSRYAWGGPVLLRVEDSFAVAIGKDIAVQISAQEVGAP